MYTRLIALGRLRRGFFASPAAIYGECVNILSDEAREAEFRAQDLQQQSQCQ